MKKILFALIVCSSQSFGFKLNNPAICDYTLENKTEVQVAAITSIVSIFESQNIERGDCLGWTNMGNGNDWNYITDEFAIYKFDISNEKYLGRFPLVRWPHEYIHPEIHDKALGVWGGRPYEPELALYDYQDSGSLAQNPLRYGDVDGNGSNEIVIITQEDLLFFSPELEKTIFMLRYNADEWLTPEASTEFYSWIKGGTREGLNLPQFQSEFYSMVTGSTASIDTALRGIS